HGNNISTDVGVDRREYAAIYRDEVRRELNHHFFAGQDRPLLPDLGEVSVFRYAIGAHAFVAFGEKIVGFQLSPRASDTTQTRDQNSPAFNSLPANQRPQRNENARRIATRTRD